MSPLAVQRPSVDVEALVAATVTAGFGEAVARRGIAAELEAWSEEAIATQLATEVHPNMVSRLPRAVLVIAARTLPASAMRQVFAARALGARVLVKAASGQEALGAALAAGDAGVVATPFASSDRDALEQAVAEVDAVVVLGSDETVTSVRDVVPAHVRFVAHGHRASAAWMNAGASDADIAGLAEDVLAWDQAGCLAPQVVWVEGDRDLFATRLARALVEREADATPWSAAARHAHMGARTLAIMAGGRVWTSAKTTLATHPEPSFRASPGQRLLWLLPADVAALHAFEPHLSTLAVSGAAPTTAAHVRRCAPGAMQRPELAWHQDGLPLFASLIEPR